MERGVSLRRLARQKLKKKTIMQSLLKTKAGRPDESSLAFFHRIIEGSNGLPPALSFGNPGFSAGYGYDNCTGNGSLWGANFFPQLLITDVSATTGPGGISNLNVTATSTSAVATWTAVSGAVGYVVQLADLDVGYVYPPTKAYLTKQTKMKLTGLTPGTSNYSLIVWAISTNSFSEGAASFSTKP
jgi:hypothetical protein